MPNTTTHTRSVRRAIVGTHVDAIRRAQRLRKSFDGLAEDVKAELRAIAARKDWQTGRDAQKLLDGMVAEAERAIRDVLRVQMVASFRNTVKALGWPAPVARAMVVTPEAVDDPTKPTPKFIGAYGAMAALLFVGMMAYRSGNKGGLVTAELGVDQLKTRAKKAAEAHVLATSNRAIISAVENAYHVPVAKRIEQARRIPVAKLIPVAARKYPPFILNIPPKESPVGPSPVVITSTPLPKLDKSGFTRGPAPGEPDFVILPERGYMPPDDPTRPIRPAAAGLVGWQVLSMLDERVRPKHRERHGRVYYYNPRPERGERGMDEMPNPPYESPNDGGVWAPNCRCVLVPVFEGR